MSKGKLPSALQRGPTSSVMGYTLELLAVADLNTRCVHTGGFAYLNPAPFTAHDAFVKTSDGWRTIQVKAAQAYRGLRGGMSLHKRSGASAKDVKSDILALVDFDHMLIRYVGVSTPLPQELPKGVAGLCRFSSSTAELASAPLSAELPTQKSKPASGASTTENNSTSSSHALPGSQPGNMEREDGSDRREGSNHSVIPLPPQSEVASGE